MNIHISVLIQKNPENESYVGVIALMEGQEEMPSALYTFDILYDEKEKMKLIIYSNDSQEVCAIKYDEEMILEMDDRSCTSSYSYLVSFIIAAVRFRLQKETNLIEPYEVRTTYALPNAAALVDFQKLINQKNESQLTS